jgi:cell division protein FtsI (penicillin-binding protein 3)
MNKPFRAKIISVFICFCVLFSIVAFKAFFIQVVNQSKLSAYSRSQTVRVAEVYPNRGNIYDRNGNPLAINIETYSLFALPKNIINLKETVRSLNRVAPELKFWDIFTKLKGQTKYTWIARKLPLKIAQVEKIKSIAGIYIEAVPKRIYPNKELLSQTLGFVGLDNKGLSGLEYALDAQLRGRPRVIKYLKDAKGRAIKFETEENDEVNHDVSLTIDKDLQAISEKALKDAVIKYNGISGGVGVIDSQSGEILAVANYPTYDLTNVTSADVNSRKLSFVTDPIEPGSVFKIFTVASALENKIATPDTNYYCEQGKYLVGDHYISEAEAKKKYEWLSVDEIIRYSSNIGTTKIAFDLTFPKLRTTLQSLNFGEKTGVEIPGESRGIFPNKENVSPISLSNISFGQGIAVTGIQLLSAYAAISNGGLYYRPTIIKSDKEKKPFRVFSEKTSLELSKMLVNAVEKGTGTNAIIPHFSIAGKTSTAQRPNRMGGYSGYTPGFVGFPINVQNRFVIFAYVDGVFGPLYYGNEVAAPIFKKIAEYILLKNKEFDHVARDTTDGNSDEKVLDNITMRESSVRYMGEGTIPNFIGLDKSTATKLAEKLNIILEHRGMGLVTQQSIVSGVKFEETARMSLYYNVPKYE